MSVFPSFSSSAHHCTSLLFLHTKSLQVSPTWLFFCLHVSLLCPNVFCLLFPPRSASPTADWASHECEKGHDYSDLCLFYLTHLLAGMSTHHWMLNSIKGNATVIKGPVSQLLLAQTRRALKRNHWRTSGARLNTHTQSPKARRQAGFLFFIFSLREPGARESYARAFIDPEHGPPEPLPLLTLSTYELTQALQFFIMWNVDVIEKFCHPGPDSGADERAWKPHWKHFWSAHRMESKN